MWVITAFAALGLVVGNLVGLTATPVVASVLGLLFAFAGGSILTFFHKYTHEDRNAAARGLLALALGCLVGVYAGIFVSERRLLSPAHRRGTANVVARGDDVSVMFRSQAYLRSSVAEKADVLDNQYQNGEISAPTAFRELYRAVKAEDERR
jgi:hypothetical protein